MAVTYTSTELKTRLNTWLRDSSDRTFTSAEKGEFYLSACRDQYVYKIGTDSSLVSAANTWTYAVPTGFTDAIVDVGYDADGTGAQWWFGKEQWEVIDGNIIFDRMTALPTGRTIYIRGKMKLTEADVVPEYLSEYILHLAMVEAFEMLKSALTTRFLKNDITMSEIIASINTHRQKAAEIRQTLPNKYPTQG